MDKQTCKHEIKKLLDIENINAQKLISVLKQESLALPKDPDKLQDIENEKIALLEELDQGHSLRNALLQQLGYSPSYEGTESLIAWCDSSGELILAWRQFMDKIQQCKHLNSVNGSIINNGLRVVKQALSILQGGQSNGPSIYDAKGQQQGPASGRAIAKA